MVDILQASGLPFGRETPPWLQKFSLSLCLTIFFRTLQEFYIIIIKPKPACKGSVMLPYSVLIAASSFTFQKIHLFTTNVGR